MPVTFLTRTESIIPFNAVIYMKVDIAEYLIVVFLIITVSAVHIISGQSSALLFMFSK